MAAEYLRQHGIDLEAELRKAQLGTGLEKQTSPAGPTTNRPPKSSRAGKARPLDLFQNVSLPSTPAGRTWDISIADGKILAITQHNPEAPNQLFSPQVSHGVNGYGSLLAPSLCHPHVHIDKAFLLSHPKHSHLQIERGDFAEAMELTGKAKASFEEDDLLERGQRLIEESIAAGVTHMRAFVEVDAGVRAKCLDAGIKLKKKAERDEKMQIQICAFAQLPLFSSSPDDGSGNVIRGLMEQAAGMSEVAVLGSTPYVESDRTKLEQNIQWMVELAAKHQKHLDFHLDYNVDETSRPSVHHVISTLKSQDWSKKTQGRRSVVLGHCSRLASFSPAQWRQLRDDIGNLPISFCGLPSSDLFMMRPTQGRGTLDVLDMITEYGINACIGINNVGNAFTPYGSCDPLTLACNGIGIYQAGTKRHAELLFECISTRARQAIGFDITPRPGSDDGLALREGSPADLVLFGRERESWRTRRNVAEAVYLYDHNAGRRACLAGKLTS